MTTIRQTAQQGFTLVEAMVVIVLAGVVTIGILGFYLNSQATWIDGSSQALTQREATLLIESIAERTHEAAQILVLPTTPPSGNQMVQLMDKDGNPLSEFTWEASDSLVYLSQVNSAGVMGEPSPITTSVVESFQLTFDTSPLLLHLTRLQLRSSDGARITMSSMFAPHNAP